MNNSNPDLNPQIKDIALTKALSGQDLNEQEKRAIKKFDTKEIALLAARFSKLDPDIVDKFSASKDYMGLYAASLSKIKSDLEKNKEMKRK